MADNQRSRILEPTIAAASELGYANMSVDDVLTRAGVSRRTFYELFENKHEAFLAAFDDAAAHLLAAVRRAYRDEATFEQRVVAGLRAFLDLIVAMPGAARVCTIEVIATGPDAVARRSRVMVAFGELFVQDAHLLPALEESPAIAAEAMVGGVYETVINRIAADRIEELPSVLPDLVESVLLPYVGPDAAAAQARALRQTAAPSSSAVVPLPHADGGPAPLAGSDIAATPMEPWP